MTLETSLRLMGYPDNAIARLTGGLQGIPEELQQADTHISHAVNRIGEHTHPGVIGHLTAARTQITAAIKLATATTSSD